MINEEKLSTIIEVECKKIGGIYENYSSALHKTAKNIILLEYEHKMKTISIQKKMRERCQILGKIIAQEKNNSL